MNQETANIKNELVELGISKREVKKIIDLNVSEEGIHKCNLLLRQSENSDELVVKLFNLILDESYQQFAFDKKGASKMLNVSMRKIDDLRNEGMLVPVNLSKNFYNNTGRKTYVYTPQKLKECLNNLTSKAETNRKGGAKLTNENNLEFKKNKKEKR